MYADTSPFDRRTESTDWSESYQNHPAVFLGLAIGIGVVLGVMKARRSYQSALTNRSRPWTPAPRRSRRSASAARSSHN